MIFFWKLWAKINFNPNTMHHPNRTQHSIKITNLSICWVSNGHQRFHMCPKNNVLCGISRSTLALYNFLFMNDVHNHHVCVFYIWKLHIECWSGGRFIYNCRQMSFTHKLSNKKKCFFETQFNIDPKLHFSISLCVRHRRQAF
jgi:hypothetical protein